MLQKRIKNTSVQQRIKIGKADKQFGSKFGNLVGLKGKYFFLNLVFFLPIEIRPAKVFFFTPDIWHIRQTYGQICDLDCAKLHL